jgi:hypothetical protein
MLPALPTVDANHEARRERAAKRPKGHRLQPISNRSLVPRLFTLRQIFPSDLPVSERIMKALDRLQAQDPIRMATRPDAGIVLQAQLGGILECELALTSAEATTERRCARVSITISAEVDEAQARLTHHPGPPHDRPQLAERIQLEGVGAGHGSAPRSRRRCRRVLRFAVSDSRSERGGSGHQ